jgi:hyperosmotically inducible periplasmic protein
MSGDSESSFSYAGFDHDKEVTMNIRKNTWIPRLLLATAVACGAGRAVAAAAPAAAAAATAPATNSLSGQVNHALSMMPRYTVFDSVAFKVRGTKVILLGAVTDPSIKSDAENAAKGVKGVTQVVDKIQVLPPSPMDDQTRQAEFHAIYDFPSLQRYGVGALKAIHIIVNNGHVTLVGTVDSKADADTANIRANSVPGVFSVTNQLTVQGSQS